jgi:uncharacterized protein YbjQ (UPF0145 family)
MILTTTESVSERKIVQTLGLVRGSAIRTRHIFTDITEFIRNLVGADLREYVKMLAETREQALDLMTQQARTLGADAVVGVRLVTSRVAAGAAEIIAFGTAVKLE